jgi:hypothetical protein
LQCVVRYDKENMAKEVLEKALAANNNELVIHEKKLESRVLEGKYNYYDNTTCFETSLCYSLDNRDIYMSYIYRYLSVDIFS